jgi:hypothetical protein
MHPQEATLFDCPDPPLTPRELEVLIVVEKFGNGVSFAGDTPARRKAAIGLIDAELLSGSYKNCSLTEAGLRKLGEYKKL